MNPESLIAYERIRRHIGGFDGRGAEHYFSLFCEPHLGTAPFGSRVWDGIKGLAGSGAELRHYPLEDIRLGWPQAPQPFSFQNAQLPLERDQWWQMPYPAVFVKRDGDLWIVRCLAILLNNGKNWCTHWSRVTSITTDEDVMPPSLRLGYAGGLDCGPGRAPQIAASSASTSTAPGTSIDGSCSAATSSLGDDTDCMIIIDPDCASSGWELGEMD
ncbi:hypothetical protein N9L68_07555 [bacterium]|nr:hypothetical protein [bacterium]